MSLKWSLFIVLFIYFVNLIFLSVCSSHHWKSCLRVSCYYWAFVYLVSSANFCHIVWNSVILAHWLELWYFSNGLTSLSPWNIPFISSFFLFHMSSTFSLDSIWKNHRNSRWYFFNQRIFSSVRQTDWRTDHLRWMRDLTELGLTIALVNLSLPLVQPCS